MTDLPPMVPSAEERAGELQQAVGSGQWGRASIAERLEATYREGALAERAKAAVEAEWLRRLLLWCRPRLHHPSYQAWLDKYLAAGPSPAPLPEPAVIKSRAVRLQKSGA